MTQKTFRHTTLGHINKSVQLITHNLTQTHTHTHTHTPVRILKKKRSSTRGVAT
jgi:hypothetical protein